MRGSRLTARRRATSQARAHQVSLHVGLFVALTLLAPSGAAAAFEFAWPDARTAGLGVVQPDPLAAPLLKTDQSHAAADSSRALVRVSGGELFGLSEARGFRTEAVVATGIGSVGVIAAQTGGSLYRERTLGASLRGRLRSGSQVELGLRGLAVGADGASERWTVALDIRALHVAFGRLVLGAAAENVGGSRVGGSPVASRVAGGCSLMLDGLTLRLSTMLEPGFDASMSLGCEFSVSRWLKARIGTSLEPERLAAGLGFEIPQGARRYELDVAWQWHPRLGGSSFASVGFRW